MTLKEEYINTFYGVWQTTRLDAQYRIERTEDSIIITFQGSTSPLDWKHNFSFWKKPYNRMSTLFFVHAGFLKMYKSVRPYIAEAVKNAFEEDKLIKIRGYSQGAALALLAHEDVFFNYNVHPDTVVFGCPRVFSIFGSKELKFSLGKVVRVENGNDIFTKIPVWFYRHYGTVRHTGSKRQWWKISFRDHLKYKENL